MDEFLKKYESQRVKWEKIKNSPGVNRQMEEEQKELEQSTFKPEINLKSKQISKDLERIENRVKVLYEGKQKKLKELEQ